ncbi:hypothetical protein HAX54_022992 [Datura stramonium]|uniref:Uncharacterized protein n=1 Tax=Datura stramonium TaxID=4076 RepID=A0ABS8UWW8_DATST|nr:hypothetical protein [Datura stramonium]
MSIARDAAVNRFTEDPDCMILLMSFKAGGVALNLTVASHHMIHVMLGEAHLLIFARVFLMDSPGGILRWSSRPKIESIE